MSYGLPCENYTDGTPSQYPVRWSELMGDIFHPLAYEYRHRILQLDMAPLLENYKCRRQPGSSRRSRRLVCAVRALQRS